MRPYEGLFTAMVTPFRADGAVNEEAAAPSPPPVAQPAVPPVESAAPSAGDAPAPQAPPARPESDAADEDRNHPSYAPPKLSSGDPLAG